MQLKENEKTYEAKVQETMEVITTARAEMEGADEQLRILLAKERELQTHESEH